jgi:hypothetical protein
LLDFAEKLARCDFEARKLPVFVISVPHQLIEIAEASFD